MIGKLKGVIDEIGEDHVILDVGGVGYRVFVSHCALSNIGEVGKGCSLFIETQMREDAIRLFGFIHESERAWFRLLQHVQGVGAKVALALLGTLSVAEIADAVALRDAGILTRAPGVGKKVAERMITELKGKVSAIVDTGGGTLNITAMGMGFDSQAPTAVADAISALGNLGYGRDQAAMAVTIALKEAGEESGSAKLIRLALQQLSKA